jgi:hypothetical protein
MYWCYDKPGIYFEILWYNFEILLNLNLIIRLKYLDINLIN